MNRHIPITRPFWRYYGGKFRAAHRYPAPKHKTLVEPFAGAAGYACRYAHHDVILIDASEKVCAVWEYLIGAKPAEILALPNLTRGQSVDDLALPQDVRWFLGFWCGNGIAQPCKSPSVWSSMVKPGFANWNTPGTRETIANQAEAIKHWRVIHGAYIDAPDVEATWFVDPPYQGKNGSHYPHGSGAINFERLAMWCRFRAGNVIACEGEGADWLPFTPLGQIKSSRGHSSEVVWCSDGWAVPVQGDLL